ncbi:hypothetical protein XOC_0972 [Xanthomonas oryzae pv. oryzicola BLS256]|uniref:Uncharacterized protein n=2 Tax=Xanthomonas oryzae TaxID=347 RepID=A0A0K0GI34_XANOP|nr:hypothetical protein PXO_04575 [Xanthomonas oryzae pv. oryzae PXO99A]AEQ95178.1 hypothetical protein XOC_0972 [Xanthomonas oryzae pv. oryzicola BLS256]QEO98951.1 hypothetical protein XOCgx_3964 [Xanthomonas oryzae pv. oryzicola]
MWRADLLLVALQRRGDGSICANENLALGGIFSAAFAVPAVS